ncbi:hypothetical protein RND81_06G170800 [Saponaria officinalis]|uniref:Protein kinase domain-containing protein n=1 Tax=Saponaria officinalis TaxID=3572 RepID=A0AAW1K791_SAPOF
MIAVMDCNDSSNSSSSNLADLNSSNNNIALNDDEMNPRVKFLCSFGGSILPRPQDGKLRYVGGETRIVSVPREVGCEELMRRMRELYEGAAILKYQQPDEDLDALVSVVNDDDVVNMMEEYDKLGFGDGFTRLRIFLFSHPEQDMSPHFMDGDERDTERRYVDALNSLNESQEYGRQQMVDSPVLAPVDEVQIADQLFNSMNLNGSVHNLRNYDMGMPQYNLRQLAVPSLGSGQHSGYAPQQRYNEEGSWSPAYYSPRCAAPLDARTFTENPSSPSSARYHGVLQEGQDKFMMDRFPEEPSQLHMNSQIPFDQQHQYSDNVVWLPTGGVPVDRGGFPGNILSGPSAVDGSNACGHCKFTFQRNPSSSDFHWKPDEQSHLEQPTTGNGFSPVMNPCVECLPRREAAMLNTESKHYYNREQGDPNPQYNESQYLDRGRMLQNQLRMDEQRAQVSGVGRIGEHYSFTGAGTNTSVGQANFPDGNLMPTSYTRHEDPRYTRAGVDLRGDMYHSPVVGAASHVHIPLEERGVRTSNLPNSYGADMGQQVLHSNSSAQVMWRNSPAPMHVPPAYDSYNIQPRNSMPSTVVPRNNFEDSSGLFVGGDHSPWAESSHRILGVQESGVQDYPYSNIQNPSPGAPYQEIQHTFTQDHLRNPPSMLNVPPAMDPRRTSESPAIVLNDSLLPSDGRGYTPVQRDNTGNIEARFDERSVHCEASEITHLRNADRSDLYSLHPTGNKNFAEKNSAAAAFGSNSVMNGDQATSSTRPGVTNTNPVAENEDLSFLPELIASAKRARMESVEIVKARAHGDTDGAILQDQPTRMSNVDETETEYVVDHLEDGSDDENDHASAIERTKAEEEALARGLQTINSADVEEIRELGTGTYGSVYYGKWKGSDVAIKRIKASCFSGEPSERERLIADFWKEALILSSLHHPNVVSFYGIVRDGPDGSLATVTEFMVNGSLKQYLRKKDRTIDRRKRLIIAMDAAFGMEYLHGKNIVHFDLKCENLLVNMRDPQRPVCKICDLGLSKVKQHTLVSGGVRGTLPWMAPELLSGKSNMVTEKIDVYSFGMVMWEVLTGEEPYKDMHCASIIGGIVNNTLRPQIPTWCDPEWKSLMESCWAPEPTDRPSFPEISQKLRAMAAAMNIK